MTFLLKDVSKKSGPILWNEGSFESFIDGFFYFLCKLLNNFWGENKYLKEE